MDDLHASSQAAAAPAELQRPAFREALKVWFQIGCLSFGGPAGQIATMHRILVDERKWIDEPRFLHALNFCMLLPGPEAMQLATYAGWKLHGVRGGLAAGLLYLASSLVLNGIFLWHAWALRRTGRADLPMRTFKYSIKYLAWLFAALLVDHYLPLSF